MNSSGIGNTSCICSANSQLLNSSDFNSQQLIQQPRTPATSGSEANYLADSLGVSPLYRQQDSHRWQSAAKLYQSSRSQAHSPATTGAPLNFTTFGDSLSTEGTLSQKIRQCRSIGSPILLEDIATLNRQLHSEMERGQRRIISSYGSLELEALAAVHELATHVKQISVSEILPRTADLIFKDRSELCLMFLILKNQPFTLELTMKGWRICSSHSDCMNGDYHNIALHTRYFNNAKEVLDVISPEHDKHFNEVLAERLKQLEREGEEDERGEKCRENNLKENERELSSPQIENYFDYLEIALNFCTIFYLILKILKNLDYMRLQSLKLLFPRCRRIWRDCSYGKWTKDMDDPKHNKDEFHYELGRLGDSDVGPSSRVSFLSKDMEAEHLSAISTVSTIGFRLVDQSFLFGPIAVFPKTTLSWRVLSPSEITAESLELFFMLQPKLDILLIGVGNKKDIDLVRKNVGPAISKARIGYEILDTEDAASTFNFLNAENRYVAAALFPPSDLHVSDSDNINFIHELRGGLDGMEGNVVSLGVNATLDSLIAGEDKHVRFACYNIWGHRTPKAEEMVQIFHKMRDLAKERSVALLEEKRKENVLEHTRLLDEMKKRVETELLARNPENSLVESGEDSSTMKKN
ncbi:hypothetical protein Mgra_00000199 [Meloidogyne graminicola]|uniref:NADH dehydrogenase [ubiquinone] 1 alpha subcomplex assembly factor 3 n=1 Tax=Meloidogyne graminicola TaxID=189291 RepID=A0A8T0A4S5_9BILA|nr:hypothetical protein Mgra_00000199 [Meloidogyne graminicola]